MFKETEWRKTISIPIVNDNQYESDMDFYLILKNPEGGASLGDPSVTRVTIIDDDGEFAICQMFSIYRSPSKFEFIFSLGSEPSVTL